MSIRTTITLEEDVYVRLQARAKERGLTFKEAVNETIRSGLQTGLKPRTPFQVKPITYARPLPGINYDCTSELLEKDEKLP
ncbi:MAG: hypothetical protein U0R19_18670 [Bryobacteraceae bacterium]